ncbi:MAG: hypothetical protein M5U28_38950 [Sandaracinaceae bacterium]|nr:hypothetical protein [Sandaracinaceae bacterium]
MVFEALAKPGRILRVARQAAQILDEDHIDAPFLDRAQKCEETRPIADRAGDRLVSEGQLRGDHAPALLAPPAHLRELIPTLAGFCRSVLNRAYAATRLPLRSPAVVALAIAAPPLAPAIE